LAGILFKIWFIIRFKKLSLITYLLMGWLSMVLIADLWHTLPRPGFWLLLAGGLCFTVGAGFYAAKRYRYTHAIWHVFVAAGAACHCLLIGLYVIPAMPLAAQAAGAAGGGGLRAGRRRWARARPGGPACSRGRRRCGRASCCPGGGTW
ncbi:MAG: hemolysin III family protein, partial [Perlucidibaca sp.]